MGLHSSESALLTPLYYSEADGLWYSNILINVWELLQGTLAGEEHALQWKNAQGQVASEWGPARAEKHFWECSMGIGSSFVNRNLSATAGASSSWI